MERGLQRPPLEFYCSPCTENRDPWLLGGLRHCAGEMGILFLGFRRIHGDFKIGCVSNGDRKRVGDESRLEPIFSSGLADRVGRVGRMFMWEKRRV